MKTIRLTHGQVALVDDHDYEWLSQHNWFAIWNKHVRGSYAVRSSRSGEGTKRHVIYMHRQILGLAYGDPREGDHIEPSETLNNCRSNLRVSTGSQNRCNARKSIRNSSGFKGVSPGWRPGKWQAHIKVRGETIHLGTFDNPEDGYAAYCEAAKRYHCEFARLT